MEIELVRLTPAAPSRPLLVLGPSLGTSVAALWGECAALLAARFEVVGFDLPGHAGRPAASSPFTVADVASGVADAVGRRGPFHYAGDSFGGAVGFTLSVDRPESLLTATLACTGAVIGTPGGWRERAAAVRADGLAPQVAGSAERWFAPGFVEREPARASSLLDVLAACDAESYALACEALATYDVRARLTGIRTPLTLVGGRHDLPTPVSGLAEVESVVPGARLVVLDVGHQAPLEAPAATAAAIAGAADGVDPALAAATIVRREVLGDDWVDRARTDGFGAGFQEYITRHAWGAVWTRPGLPKRDRSIVTLVALVAGGHQEELAGHLRGALRNGLGRDEIAEVLIHAAVYVGVPAVNTAFRTATRVFAELDASAEGERS